MTNYATQQQNDDMMSLIASQFRLLYNPVHSFADVMAMMQMFPGLLGLWTMNHHSRSAPTFLDVTNNVTHLTSTNAVSSSAALQNYAEFNGTTAYLARTDDGKTDVLGTEAFIIAAQRGLTWGGWFQFDRLSTAEGLIGKFGSGTNQSYLLQKFGGNTIGARISNDGSTVITATSIVTVNTSGWFFIYGEFIPSTSLTISINGVRETNVTSIPASIFNSSAAFTIGCYDGGSLPTQPLDGRCGYSFLCCASGFKNRLDTFYQMTAPLFNVSI